MGQAFMEGAKQTYQHFLFSAGNEPSALCMVGSQALHWQAALRVVLHSNVYQNSKATEDWPGHCGELACKWRLKSCAGARGEGLEPFLTSITKGNLRCANNLKKLENMRKPRSWKS